MFPSREKNILFLTYVYENKKYERISMFNFFNIGYLWLSRIGGDN